jgi:hypothetical protein
MKEERPLRESVKCAKKKSLFPGFKPKDLLFLASFASLRENVLAVDLISRTNSFRAVLKY